LNPEEALEHYSRELVRREVVGFCRGRWVALECYSREGRLFLRYSREQRPLSLSSEEELEQLLKRYRGLKPRSVYASANVYRRLESQEDTESRENIMLCTPTWDIDCRLSDWRAALEAARAVVDYLEKAGVAESVYLKWSGEGVHVHVHERAFSQSLLRKASPLDLAYSVVEYVARQVQSKVSELADRGVKLENVMDLKRVFTAPLSLHRKLDLCCVCFKPGDLDSFELEWADPKAPRHSMDWRKYSEGELDHLAEKALAAVGGYPGWPGSARKAARPAVGRARRPSGGGRLGRFQVMALLQAARYYLLTGDIEKAKSFGLNRAIFYAWAKHYGPRGRPKARRGRGRAPAMAAERAEEEREGERMVYIGDEGAFISDRGWFKIGDMEQTPEDYDRQVKSRIEAVMSYDEAWEAAVSYLRKFPREVLLSQQRFFSQAYKPVRDKFTEVAGKRKRTLEDWW